ncbi:MAG TPA: hypothetical protein VFG69_11440 [Nannocystaceae bacterium]|nr:hypothetical protein [Nannocystaceae bacterium]
MATDEPAAQVRVYAHGEPVVELPPGAPGCELVRRLASGAHPPRVRSADVMKEAERLGFVTRIPGPRGHMTVLPRAHFLERCVDAFAQRHRDRIGAVELTFPLVYDHAHADLAELTSHYEGRTQVFALGGADAQLRLAYAADPGLLGWLRGRRLVPAALPYVISSPGPVFRRWMSGQLGDLDHLMQYPLSDLHMLARDGTQARELARRHFVEAAADLRVWVGDDWAGFVDATAEFLAAWPDIGRELSLLLERPFVVRTLPRQPRYYAMRAGLTADAGYADVMLYNLQWDEENPQRFDVRLATGEHPVLLHGNLVTGWPLLLPIMLGRGLADLGPRAIPPELSPCSLRVLPIRAELGAVARAWIDTHAPAVRAEIDLDGELTTRIRRSASAWEPWVVVLGPRELDGQADARVQGPFAAEKESWRAALARRSAWLQRAAPISFGRADPPPFAPPVRNR